ncbi:type VI secretion system ATPase TssH [Longibacter sp.]|uniref:type VI secretion system ATPase TssH n=1 Tax=Longibacter sp. TaxID=2045415 RepID=UPI003EB783C5
MVAKDVKKLLQKLNDHSTRALEAAAGFCTSRMHYEVTLHHLLLKLMEDGGGDIPRILSHFGVDDGELWQALLVHIDELKAGNTGRPTFSPPLMDLLEDALVVATVHHDARAIRSGYILEALREHPTLFTGEIAEALAPIRSDELREQFRDITAGSDEDRVSRTTRPMTSAAPASDGETADDSALGQYTYNLTQQARGGDIDPIYARDGEIRQIVDILSRRRKNNPILVGEAGVGKTAVVEGLALRVAAGDVPKSLAEAEIRVLDLGLLQAGAGVKGEFESRLKSVIQEVREAARPTLLFIDEAHTLIGAGGKSGTGDAANLLKPALARGELRTIAATTWSEYKQYIEKDPALERRFQLVKIDEPSPDMATIMLQGIKSKYESHHDVHITAEAARAAAFLSDRFIAGRQLPDKAVDLMDTAAARVKMSQDARPAALDTLQRRLDHLHVELTALERDLSARLRADDGELDTLRERIEALEAEYATLEARWHSERSLVDEIEDVRRKIIGGSVVSGDGVSGDGASESGALTAGTPTPKPASTSESSDEPDVEDAEASPNPSEMTESDAQDVVDDLHGRLDQLGVDLEALRDEEPALVHAEVNEDAVARIISDWTGIPLGNMLRDEAETLLSLEDRLQSVIRGQNEALGEVADSIRSAKAGMGNPDAPIAVFLLVGPSGVGKTETARQLARQLFGGERFLTTINMSEYQESHTVAQLKGAPPGYVGYGEGGILTEAVRRRPYSVVLLDEVEKAHVDVMELFYQVFDRGFMRDGEGREISFKNTVILMTSNIGSDVFLQVCTEDERPTPDQLREAIHSRLVNHFQAALLARMKVVPYYPLVKDAMMEITRLKLGTIGTRLERAHEMEFGFAPDVVDRIAERCTQVDSGARNIDFILDRTVLPEASRALLGHMAEETMPNALTLGFDDEGNFTYTFGDEIQSEARSAEPFAEAGASDIVDPSSAFDHEQESAATHSSDEEETTDASRPG